MNKRGLGRGLGALIADTETVSKDAGESILSIDIQSIEPNPAQPRKHFDEEELRALAASIRERGVLQPILVRPGMRGNYQLIAGERRWRASRLAGYEQIPAIVKNTTDEELLPLALIENLVREDLNPIEEGLAYRQLQHQTEWSQGDLADQVGRSRSHVANAMRLLNLPEDIQEDVAAGRLTAGHARSILSCESEARMRELRDTILAGNLSVREAERASAPADEAPAPARPRGKKKKPANRNVSPETRELEERLTRTFGTPAQIHEKDGRGRVTLEFYSYEDLDRLTELLMLAGSRGGFGA